MEVGAMTRAEKMKLLLNFTEYKGTALDALEKLAKSSSSVSFALHVCKTCADNPKAQEKVADSYIRCYAAGFIACLDSEPKP
jgi:hypothetical protein